MKLKLLRCETCGGSLGVENASLLRCIYCGSLYGLQSKNPGRGSRLAGLLVLADQSLLEGKIDEAHRYFNRVIELDPGNVEAWIGRGLSEKSFATSSFDKAISLAADEDAVKVAIADAICQRSSFPFSETLSYVVALDPHNASANYEVDRQSTLRERELEAQRERADAKRAAAEAAQIREAARVAAIKRQRGGEQITASIVFGCTIGFPVGCLCGGWYYRSAQLGPIIAAGAVGASIVAAVRLIACGLGRVVLFTAISLCIFGGTWSVMRRFNVVSPPRGVSAMNRPVRQRRMDVAVQAKGAGENRASRSSAPPNIERSASHSSATPALDGMPEYLLGDRYDIPADGREILLQAVPEQLIYRGKYSFRFDTVSERDPHAGAVFNLAFYDREMKCIGRDMYPRPAPKYGRDGTIELPANRVNPVNPSDNDTFVGAYFVGFRSSDGRDHTLLTAWQLLPRQFWTKEARSH